MFEKRFYIIFTNGEQSLYVDHFLNITDKTPFIVTSTLMTAFKPVIEFTNEEQITEATKSIVSATSLIGKMLNTQISTNDIFGGSFFGNEQNFISELKSLKKIIVENNISSDNLLNFSMRLLDAPLFPQVTLDDDNKIIFMRTHKSSNLLSLAWAEMWNYMESKIERIKLCPYCYKIYIAPKNNPDKATCGFDSCKKMYLIDFHGGIEGYREWERRRKILRKGNNPVGRPRKKTKEDIFNI
jgi:hypothetical protein